MTTKNKALIGMICGIVALVGDWIPVVKNFLFVIGVAGIVFSALALKDRPQGQEKGMAIAGLVCSIVAVAWGIIGLICTCLCVGAMAGLAEAASQMS